MSRFSPAVLVGALATNSLVPKWKGPRSHGADYNEMMCFLRSLGVLSRMQTLRNGKPRGVCRWSCKESAMNFLFTALLPALQAATWLHRTSQSGQSLRDKGRSTFIVLELLHSLVLLLLQVFFICFFNKSLLKVASFRALLRLSSVRRKAGLCSLL